MEVKDRLKDSYQQQQAKEEELRSFQQSQASLVAAMTVKQGRQEPPIQYYRHLLLAYFGSQNKQGMEEHPNFKTLFVIGPMLTSLLLKTQRKELYIRKPSKTITIFPSLKLNTCLSGRSHRRQRNKYPD